MNDELFGRFVRDLVEDLQQVSGANLEKLFRPLWDKMAGAPVQANGLNLEGAPMHVRKAAPHIRHLQMFSTRVAGPEA